MSNIEFNHEADQALVERQIALEEEMVSMGVSRYRKDRPMPWAESAGKFDEASLPPGAALMRKYTGEVARLIQGRMAEYQAGKAGRYARTVLTLLDGIEPDALAYIALRRALQAAVEQANLVSAAVSIGSLVEEHVAYEEWHATEKNLAKWWEEQAKRKGNPAHRRAMLRGAFQNQVRDLEWPRESRLKVGVWLLELLEVELGLIERFTERVNTKTRYVIRPTEELREWLDEMHSKCELLAPVNLPMVCPPRPWTTPMDGGYTTRPLNRCLVIKAPKTHIDDLFSTDLTRVYSAVNALQETRWQINPSVLDTVRALKGARGVPGVPEPEDEMIPPRPAEVPEDVPISELSHEGKRALRAWKAQAKQAYERNAERVSARFSFQQKLWVAEKFAAEPAIWFPYQIDSRGRIYAIPSMVTPQGDDLSKALLRFADGKPLGENGAYWLAVHVANVWAEDDGSGVKTDKLPFDDRVQWVLDNEEMIVECALRTLDSLHMWGHADKPWQFLAACFEWAGYVLSGRSDDYVSHLPIAMDGSCSGLQHYSAVLRDPRGARAVNLTNTGTVEDIYQQVADRVAEECEKRPELAPWRGKVVRKTVKQPCMTYAYSATVNGMRGQIIAATDKASDQPEGWKDDKFQLANDLAPVVRECIEEIVVAAAGAMAWLQEAAKIATNWGMPLRWVSAIGLPVVQAETRPIRKRNSVWYDGIRLRLDTHESGTTLDKRAQASAVAPNWIHSQDASHLMATVNALAEDGLDSFAMIHDSFGVHAADVDLLHLRLRETFIEQYSVNRLAELKRQLESHIRHPLPDLPPAGELDLGQVMEAEYAFA